MINKSLGFHYTFTVGWPASVLRIFAALPPLSSITYSVRLQWLLPFGKDWVVNRIIISAGLLNLLLAFVLAPRYTHLGIAWSVVFSECFVCVSMVVAVAKMAPFWRPSSVEQSLRRGGEMNLAERHSAES